MRSNSIMGLHRCDVNGGIAIVLHGEGSPCVHAGKVCEHMGEVTELGYLGLGVRDIGAWMAFASEVLGFEVVGGEHAKSCSFRLDYWAQRFLVSEDDSDDIAFAGWRVGDEEAFDRLRHRLQALGVEHSVASAAQATERRVLGLLSLSDPNGIRTEIFFGPQVEPGLPVLPGRRMHGPFVTGDGGLGHFVIDTNDPHRSEVFYRDVLGLRGSIEFRLRLGPRTTDMHFMSCNRRQHSVAFADFGGPRRLSHIMTEVSRLEDVGLTREAVKNSGTPIQLDIGQHHNDRAVSFYFFTPSDWAWECGWNVAPPSGQAEWASTAIWGHEYLGREAGVKRKVSGR